MNDGGLTEYWGNYTYYSEKRTAEAQAGAQAGEQAQAEGRTSWEERKQRHSQAKKRERDEQKKADKVTGIENDIEDVEKQMREAEERLADPVVCGDYGMVMELTKCYNDLLARRDGLYDLLEKETH